MATNIGKLAVTLSADTRGFASGMAHAATLVGRVQRAVGRATDSVRTWEAVTASVKDFKLAGADTLDAFRTTLAVARGELRRFSRNRDVQIALEIGREYIDESWIRIRNYLRGLAEQSGITIAAKVATDKAASLQGWIARQRRAVMKPITVRIELARRAFDQAATAARARLDTLRRYRAIRIGIAAINATRLPAAAAIATLRPLSRLAMRGLIIPLRLTHHGIALAVTKARAALARLHTYGRSVASGLTGAFSRVAGSFGGLGAMIGGGALAAGFVGISTYAVRLAADAEQARVSFTTMLGSVEAANSLLGEINTFAAATPFQTPELIDASKKLLAFGVAQEQIIPTMRSLGDIAAGLNIPLGDLAEIYGKARVQGRLFAEDVNQLTGRGIPIIKEFANQFGVTEAEVRALVESGRVNFSHLQTAIANLTAEGGQFAGLMAAQSATVSGLFSTLGDTVTMNLTRMGEAITENLDLRGMIGGITNAIDALAEAALPIIESFIGSLATSGNMGQWAGSMVLGGAELIATGLAYAIDYSKLLLAGFKLLQAGATYAVFGVVKAIDVLGQGFVDLINLLPGVDVQWTQFTGQLADGLLEEARQLKAEAGQAFDGFMDADSAKAVGRFFDDVRRNSQQTAQQMQSDGKDIASGLKPVADQAAVMAAHIGESMAKLRAEISTVGLSEADRRISELQSAGANEQQISEARELLNLRDRLATLSDISDRNPLGDYGQKIDELRQLAAQGKITAGQLQAISGTAATSLADSIKIDGDDALTEYAVVMEQLQGLYAAGKLTADQFATIRAQAQTSLNDALTQEAQRITDSVKSPLEQYTAEIDRLNELLERGLITQETFDKAALKANETLNRSTGGDKIETQGIRAGSQQAARFAYDNARGPQRINSQQEYAKAQLKETEKHTKALDKIVRNTGNPAVTLEEVDL